MMSALCLVQSLFFMLGVFMTRVSEAHPNWYIAWMPDICYYFFFLSQAILPFVVTVSVIQGILLIDDVHNMISLMAFTVFVEFGIFYSYWFQHKDLYRENHEYWTYESRA